MVFLKLPAWPWASAGGVIIGQIRRGPLSGCNTNWKPWRHDISVSFTYTLRSFCPSQLEPSCSFNIRRSSVHQVCQGFSWMRWSCTRSHAIECRCRSRTLHILNNISNPECYFSATQSRCSRSWWFDQSFGLCFDSAVRVLKAAEVILAEDTRHSARLLQHYDITTPMVRAVLKPWTPNSSWVSPRNTF